MWSSDSSNEDNSKKLCRFWKQYWMRYWHDDALNKPKKLQNAQLLLLRMIRWKHIHLLKHHRMFEMFTLFHSALILLNFWKHFDTRDEFSMFICFLNQRRMPQRKQGSTRKTNQKTIFIFVYLFACLFNLLNVGVIIYKV